jgi:hypothetical protein
MDSNTHITSKKYKTIGKLLEAPVKSIILVSINEKNDDIRNYLFEWLYLNHYSKKKPIINNLTARIHNINNKASYYYVMKYAFNDIDITKSKTTTHILNAECIQLCKQMYTIQPSLTGAFLDYLIRRIICEQILQPFHDSRAEWGKSFNQFCQFEYNCYDMVANTLEHKTCDILSEILITSLSHTLFFGGIPKKEHVDDILDLLKTPTINNVLLTPLMQLCAGLQNHEKNHILINPGLGFKIPQFDNKSIGADCDLIINDVLYDIKCTVGDKTIYEILQLLGYASLYNCNPRHTSSIKIQNISIMNVLQGEITNYDISDITEEQMFSYLKMLM